MRNVAAVGAVPWALTDCLCYGNPEKPEQMWNFVEGTRGVAEAGKNIHLKMLSPSYQEGDKKKNALAAAQTQAYSPGPFSPVQADTFRISIKRMALSSSGFRIDAPSFPKKRSGGKIFSFSCVSS